MVAAALSAALNSKKGMLEWYWVDESRKKTCHSEWRML